MVSSDVQKFIKIFIQLLVLNEWLFREVSLSILFDIQNMVSNGQYQRLNSTIQEALSFPREVSSFLSQPWYILINLL